MTLTSAMLGALEDEGYAIKEWQGRRWYLTDDSGREAGYLVADDDGTTGACRCVTRRAGHVARILREASAERKSR